MAQLRPGTLMAGNDAGFVYALGIVLLIGIAIGFALFVGIPWLWHHLSVGFSWT